MKKVVESIKFILGAVLSAGIVVGISVLLYQSFVSPALDTATSVYAKFFGSVPLGEAVRDGDLDAVRDALQDKNDEEHDYQKMLTYAVKEGRPDIVKAFLDAGVAPMPDAVESAVRGNSVAMLEMLVNSGVNLNLSQKLFRWLQWSSLSSDMVKFILQLGADPNWKNEYGETVLMVARNGNIVNILLSAGANPNSEANDGTTALMYAVGAFYVGSSNSSNFLRLLIPRSQREWLHVDVISALLNAVADPNIQDDKGMTALAHLVKNGCWDSDDDILQCSPALVDSVKIMLDAGADPNLTDVYGDTALDKADARGKESRMVARMIIRAGGKTGAELQ